MDAAKAITPSEADAGGEGGVRTPSFWDDRGHVRGHAKAILRMLQFDGLFSETEIRTILRGALPVLIDAIKNKNARNYAAVMRVMNEWAKIEQRINDQSADSPPAGLNIGAINITNIDITTATEKQLEEAIRAGVAIPAEELAKLPADVLVRLHRATARLSGST